jgi:hypothetical protein
LKSTGTQPVFGSMTVMEGAVSRISQGVYSK